MGSTITTGRVAAAVRTQDGRTLFVLFEENYSSNTYPQRPEWCCMGLGYLPATMERIFSLASSCEGGMLRNRAGRLTPEGYIGTWLKELANPLVMRRTAVRLDAGDSLYASIPATRLTTAVGLLAEAGRPAQAAELRDTQAVTLDLVRDADALLALQAGLGLDPWRLVNAHVVTHRSGERDRALGHDPAPSRAPALDTPIALRLNADVRLLRGPDGTWHCGGWQYFLVGQHVRNLWQAELACPGQHRKRITAYRNALDRAPEAPPGLMVEIDGTGITDAYYLRKIEELRQQADSKSVCFRVPVTKENEYGLTNLPRNCTRWFLPDDHHTTGAGQIALAL